MTGHKPLLCESGQQQTTHQLLHPDHTFAQCSEAVTCKLHKFIAEALLLFPACADRQEPPYKAQATEFCREICRARDESSPSDGQCISKCITYYVSRP